ncbi:hypothetical protein V7125_05075 [Neobacillus vireti]
MVSTCMLGGVYWSIELVPEFMRKIALAVPRSWAMSGFKEIISGSLFHYPSHGYAGIGRIYGGFLFNRDKRNYIQVGGLSTLVVDFLFCLL